ncbi:hypothetical protein ACLB2K_010523 [Fragaria x ananassa]
MAATMDFNVPPMTGFSRKRFFKRFLEIATFYAIKPRRKSPQKSEIEDWCDLPHEVEKIEIRDWSDLPCELLSLVAEYASLIELQSFCRVCKAWNSAYSTVLPQKLETEVNKAGPWFLLIDLPQFPDSELTDHVAAVSCSPTSQDCMVCVISRRNNTELEAKVLNLGEDQAWTQINYSCARLDIDTIKFGAYHTGEFCFLDRRTDKMLKLRTKNRAHNLSVVRITKPSPKTTPGAFFFETDELQNKFADMKKKLGLREGVSIFTCGTTTQYEGHTKFLYNERISDNVKVFKRRHFKGVWMQPRLDSRTKPINRK